MVKMHWRGKTSRAVFEGRVWDRLDEATGSQRQLERAKHYENDHEGGPPTVVWLYYDQETGKHVGSWCKGEGWIFQFGADLELQT